MILVGLSGYARTGKDTVANILQDQHGFEKVGFSDALYKMVEKIDPIIDDGLPLCSVLSKGWERVKDEYPEVRRFLQVLGTDAGRDVLGENVWVDALMRKLKSDGRYVIRDMRFPNEFWAVKAEGGKTVRIERPGYGPVNGHISETAIDDHPFDYTLSNDGTTTKLERYCAALVAELELLS